MVGANSSDETDFPYKLLLTNRQVIFANNLSKTQLSRIKSG